MTAEEIIELFGLSPHPEGGHFVETHRDTLEVGGRSAGTAIYFLLRAGERSRFHRIDAAEIWHHYAGAPLELVTFKQGEAQVSQVLGIDLSAGQRPQIIVFPKSWQAARSLGEWTLVGCTVSPAFEFSGFELAPEGQEPEGW
jgi:predicted cupin superfamily sugar epimerase